MLGNMNRKRLSIITLIFAIAFAVFFMAPPLLNKQFVAYPMMKVGDVFDIFTQLPGSSYSTLS